nr:translation initiation factor 1A [Andalucia godoyi]|eukprot:ANDGO_08186.mRNA.1 Eukaryotic translation initiation factor 1A
MSSKNVKGKGGKNRRRGANNTEGTKRELIIREEGQEYAQVLRMLGNGRLEAKCFADAKTRQCHIRGKMRKKVWINVGDIVLISTREYQDEKADVIHKYTPDEARALKAQEEIPDNIRVNEVADEGEEFSSGDDAFDFDSV